MPGEAEYLREKRGSLFIRYPQYYFNDFFENIYPIQIEEFIEIRVTHLFN